MATTRLTHRTTPGVSGEFALQFPSNSSANNTTDPYAVIQFANPHSNGFNIWGAGNTAGVTIVRKLKTKSTLQPGYTAYHWWSQNDGNFGGDVGGNWGCHPYPARGFSEPNNYGPSGSGYFIHEIATAGKDVIDDGLEWVSSGQNPNAPELNAGYAVTANTTYLQGIRITRNGASSKSFSFYINLPSTASADIITHTETTENYGESAPASPVFVFGDSPWYASYQHERADCILDAIKIFSSVLTESEMVQESEDFSRIVTTAGQSAIWWGRNGFDTGHDTNNGTITCHYGTGRAFTIINPSSNAADKISLVARI